MSGSGNQAVANAVFAAVTYDQEDYDTSALHDVAVNNTRMTVPTGWTRVRLFGQVFWASNNAGTRIVEIYKNGAQFRGDARTRYQAAGSSSCSIATPVIQCVAGDYFEFMVLHTAGGSLNVAGGNNWNYFAMEQA